ncbi:MAG: tRNA 2-selenouridine(34) synthase MnmH [Saprospiraceae bacterium]|nr:tRNA 2-selenouridine(34) synthase MnmH [Saprospiraceae bacterium]MCF8248351.1 tRNA 2-selenouridine(34) synthase MnmH [Saprospiraceae bacterium]MCF8280210.1 tRNA 2-selenouridine(34) synthase MnmH [Bacteroidales bacterium]MCF8309879.1 tRNA 2-selenouridine(34) synthase MnmH [Saprospiraceae bacterium]MCF8438790.1 tRNA 2-selenouridine(34) synthase MnmH [Saprospiraceae bacterium]
MKRINATQIFQLEPERVLLDVRTPAEYAQGHVPGAQNLPLFSDEERAEVGTLYKQASPERAFLRGLDIAGAKMSWYVKQAMKLAPEKKVAVHCWRGGQRSGSLATLLSFAKFDVQVLEGGYKAYRAHVLEHFSLRKSRFVVLGGKTGSGKTEVLKALTSLGEQVIDLEGLANHKGSAFGALGEEPQPRVEQFENDLFAELEKIDHQRRIWVENESRTIGRVSIPAGFFEQYKIAPLVVLEVPFEERIRHLAVVYATFPKDEIIESLLKITKRMGGNNVKDALEAFEAGRVEDATAIALNYYDKTYAHSTGQGNFSQTVRLEVEKMDALAIAKQLVELANKHTF